MMDELLNERVAMLAEIGYEIRYVKTQGDPNDRYWICPIGQYPEDCIAIGESQEEALEGAMIEIRRILDNYRYNEKYPANYPI